MHCCLYLTVNGVEGEAFTKIKEKKKDRDKLLFQASKKHFSDSPFSIT